MTKHLPTDTYTHDMTDRFGREEQISAHQYGHVIQSHINHIGEVIMESNDHNRYVREVLHKHLIPGGYYRIANIDDRRTIYYANNICSMAWDEYNKLTTSLPPIMKSSNLEIFSIVDAQRNMLQSVLELLESDVKTALHHIK